MEERFDYRLKFSKKGRAVYISHLDLMRTMQRAFKRAGLPIWYTQGFNPHAYIMFPLALSLGVVGECEVMDVALTKKISFDEVKSSLNEALPTGLEIVSVKEPVNEHKSIVKSEYEIVMSGDMERSDFEKFIEREKIEVKKLTKKKKEKIIDLKPYTEISELRDASCGIYIKVLLPSGCETNINPSVLLDAFADFSGADIQPKIRRTKILMANGEEFC
ncbi:MAG: TIGR03936 family radical SAM-associated protein [Ruminococcus sp.]|nr:TIGR03936 family radical SAM-associated protein [Ruminococcus sp.]